MVAYLQTATISLGQVHLSELVEACDNDLDAAATADLSQNGLVMLFWLMVRLKPTVSVGTLRVAWYTDLNTICRNKYLKLVGNPATGVEEVMNQIKAQASLDDQFIEALCQTQGWDPLWMAAPAKSGKGRGRGKAGAPEVCPGQHLLPFQVAPKAGLAAVAPPPPAKAAAQVQAVEMRAQEMQAVPAKTSPPPPKIGGVQMFPPVMATVATSGSANQVPPLTLGVPFAPLPSVPPPVPMIGGETGGQHHAPPPAEPVEPRAAEGFGEGENVEGEISSALTSASLGAVAKAGALPVPTDIAEPVPEAERAQDDELLEAELEQVFDEAVAADGAEAPADKVICGICRDEIKQGEAANSAEEAVLALECSHVYHQMCLSKTWSIGGWPRGWCPQRCLDHILLENRGGAGGVEIVIDGPAGSGPAPPAPPPRPSALSPRNGCGGVSVHRVSIMVPPAEAASETVVVDGENVALWAELRKADCNSILISTVIVSQICTIWIIAVFVMPGSCQSYLCNCWFCTFCC